MLSGSELQVFRWIVLTSIEQAVMPPPQAKSSGVRPRKTVNPAAVFPGPQISKPQPILLLQSEKKHNKDEVMPTSAVDLGSSNKSSPPPVRPASPLRRVFVSHHEPTIREYGHDVLRQIPHTSKPS